LIYYQDRWRHLPADAFFLPSHARRGTLIESTGIAVGADSRNLSGVYRWVRIDRYEPVGNHSTLGRAPGYGARCQVATARGESTTVPIIAGPLHVIVGLLLVAGVAKFVRPGATAGVAKAAGIPATKWVVRIFALVEITAAVAAFVIGGWIPALTVGILYLVFAGFVLMLKARGIKTAGCGCFGQETDDPPGYAHIMVDVVAAAIAVGAAIVAVPDIASVLAEQPLVGVPYVGFVTLGVWLLMVMLTDLPQLAYLTAEASS
jgi:hypothetical protein